MAIEFARVRYIKRSDGGNACRSAAYNDRGDLKCDRTGERFYFSHRDPVLYKNILLPEGADEKFLNAEVLWNEAQAMEKRRDSQEARELLLALPTDDGLTIEDWKVMTEEFVQEHFVSKGVAVQVDIHAAHKGDVNVHAHLLITTRRLEGGRFNDKKARDLDPDIRTMKRGIKAVTEGDRWGIMWRDYQNRYFERIGLDLTVDDIAPFAQTHEGPIRLRSRPKEAEHRAQEVAEANAAALRDPEYILAAVTHYKATFTEFEVEKLLRKHITSPQERAEIRAKVLARKDVVALYDKETAAFTNRYTLRDIRDQEQQVMTLSDKIARKRRAVKARHLEAVARKYTLEPEQHEVLMKATGTDGLVVIEGLAGTGKSHSMNAIREAHERAGWRVVGIAPTNTVVDDLRRSGFEHGNTAYTEVYWLEQRCSDKVQPWDQKTLVMVDEAAMMDTPIFSRLMVQARDHGAKLIVVGDDRQLDSVQRGGMFTVLKERHGSVVLSSVRRQDDLWQKQASEDFSSGHIEEGLRAYSEHGFVHWSTDINESKIRLLSDWDHDSRENPDTPRFVYAGTNKEVNDLNRLLREVRVKRGEVKNELEVDNKRGHFFVGAGDRIQFHKNKKPLGIYNGAHATIAEIKGNRIYGETDAGQSFNFNLKEFDEFALGYAGTIYRGQGKTQPDVYALYDNVFAWNARTAYVGMTRHQNKVELYVSRDLVQNEEVLAKCMARRYREEASLAWATEDEIMKQQENRERGKLGRYGSRSGATYGDRKKSGYGRTRDRARDDDDRER